MACMSSIICNVCIHKTIRCIADLFIYVTIYNYMFVCSYVYIQYVCMHRRLCVRAFFFFMVGYALKAFMLMQWPMKSYFILFLL